MDIMTKMKPGIDPQEAAHKDVENGKAAFSSRLAENSVVGAVQKGSAEVIDQTKQAINEVYDTTVQAAGEVYSIASQAVTETSEKALKYKRDNPDSVSLIAFGAGVGLGLLLAGSISSRRRASRITPAAADPSQTS